MAAYNPKSERLQQLAAIKESISTQLQAMRVDTVTSKVELKFDAHKNHHMETMMKMRKSEDLAKLLDDELFSSGDDEEVPNAPSVSLEQKRREEDEEWLKLWESKKEKKVNEKVAAIYAKKAELANELQKLFSEELEILVNFHNDTPGIGIDSHSQAVTITPIVANPVAQKASEEDSAKIEKLEQNILSLSNNNRLLAKDLATARKKVADMRATTQVTASSANPMAVRKTPAKSLEDEFRSLAKVNELLKKDLVATRTKLVDMEETSQLLAKKNHFLNRELANARQQIEDLSKEEVEESYEMYCLRQDLAEAEKELM